METSKKAKRILLVEDDVIMAALTKKALYDGGYRHVRVIKSSRTFHDILLEYLPDLVLLDIMLPTTDGRELAKKMKQFKSSADVPIIVFTVLPDAKKIAKDINADDYIRKPFKKADLLKKVDRLISKERKEGPKLNDSVPEKETEKD